MCALRSPSRAAQPSRHAALILDPLCVLLVNTTAHTPATQVSFAQKGQDLQELIDIMDRLKVPADKRPPHGTRKGDFSDLWGGVWDSGWLRNRKLPWLVLDRFPATCSIQSQVRQLSTAQQERTDERV